MLLVGRLLHVFQILVLHAAPPNAATPIYNHTTQPSPRPTPCPSPTRARWGNSNFQKSFPSSSIIQALFPPLPINWPHVLRINTITCVADRAGGCGRKTGSGGGKTSMGYAKTGFDACCRGPSRPPFIVTPVVFFLVQHERRGRDGGGGSWGFATAVWGGGSLGRLIHWRIKIFFGLLACESSKRERWGRPERRRRLAAPGTPHRQTRG